MHSRSSSVAQPWLCRNRRGCLLRFFVWLGDRCETKGPPTQEHDHHRSNEVLLASVLLGGLACLRHCFTPAMAAYNLIRISKWARIGRSMRHEPTAEGHRSASLLRVSEPQGEEPAAMAAISAACSKTQHDSFASHRPKIYFLILRLSQLMESCCWMQKCRTSHRSEGRHQAFPPCDQCGVRQCPPLRI